MDYREILSRYVDNLNLASDGTTLRRARQDFSDALVEIYGQSAPTKTYYKEIPETEEVIEDFADTTYLTGLTLTSGFTQAGGVITTATTGILTITGLNDINTLKLIVLGGVEVPPVVDLATGNVTVKNEIGEELFNQNFEFTDVNGASEEFTFDISKNEVNMSLIITLSKTPDYTGVSLDNLLLTIDLVKVTLPNDFFLPLEVKFEETSSSSKAIVVSNELHRERFDRWVPGRYSNPDSEVVTEGSTLKKLHASSENIEFDRTIGYTFDVQPEAIYLLFKPSFRGVLTVVYSYLPTPIMEDNQLVQMHRAFVDLLVYNATIRGIRKELMKSDMNQARVIALTLVLKEYKSAYPLKLNDFTNFMKSKAEPKVIQPHDFLNDIDMILS